MSKIIFGYPFMLFEKCSCTNQVPIQSMGIHNQSENIVLEYKLQCPVCENHLHKVLHIDQNETELNNHINAFKVIPTIKDELAIVKLDTVKAKVHNNELKLYGDYTHLRFWDNMIQEDIIKINYLKEA